jgi:predicted amidohydrolase
MHYLNQMTLFLSLLLVAAHPASSETVAMIQYDADRHYGDYDTNMHNLEILALQAVEAGATVLLFPEGSAHGYTSARRTWCRPGMTQFQGKACDDVSLVAESVPGGRSADFWQEFAAVHQALILYHIMEEDDGRFFNTTVAVDAQGVRGKYRKRYLYYIDEAYADEGTDLLTLEVAGKKFGVLICMDANFNSLFTAYRDQGVADLFVAMDWDQSPAGSRAGRVFFRSLAQRHRMNIYASDQSAWDSTGYYPASGQERTRAPLAPVAVGADGYTLQVSGKQASRTWGDY